MFPARYLTPRGWRLVPTDPGLRSASSLTLRSLVLMAVAALLILVLLPAALGAQLAIAG